MKEREQQEQDERRAETERRVKMLLQYKSNLHKTRTKLKRNTQKKEKVLKERDTRNREISTEER